MFRNTVTGLYREGAELEAVCDSNLRRAANRLELAKLEPVPAYAPEDFHVTICPHKVEVVIVTSLDRTHHHYICAALEAGCDVITEKPMTTDADKYAEILRVQQATGRRVQVYFNYRYAPRNSRVMEILYSGAIGEIYSATSSGFWIRCTGQITFAVGTVKRPTAAVFQ